MLCCVATVKSLPVNQYCADYICWSFAIIGFFFSDFENRILIQPVLGGMASVAYLSHVMRKPTFWFPTWSDTNKAVQPQKMARGLKFRI